MNRELLEKANTLQSDIEDLNHFLRMVDSGWLRVKPRKVTLMGRPYTQTELVCKGNLAEEIIAVIKKHRDLMQEALEEI